MARLPFNPDFLSTPDPGQLARRERARTPGQTPPDALTVTQISNLIKDLFATHAPTPVKVVGEVSNFRDRNHWYLSLKDENSVVDCVVWSTATRKIGFTPQQGQQVLAIGRLDHYAPQGKTQLYIDSLQPIGQGTLELRYRQLCEELRSLGFFDDARKRPLPAFPRCIAVITSASGAALHDVIRTAHQRCESCHIYVIDVRVQGAEAAPEIAAALNALSRHHARHNIDAAILTRGGGSLEDLWAFNERSVAEAIRSATLPIVAAIGHETDTTIAELVADLRCSTPTQAAARLIPDAATEHQHLQQLAQRVRLVASRRLDLEKARHAAAARFELFRNPALYLTRAGERITSLEQQLRQAMRGVAGRRPVGDYDRRLMHAMRLRSERERERINSLQRQLNAVGPASVLARGYSLTMTEGGEVVRQAEQVRIGETLVTRLQHGQLRSRVEDQGRDENTRKSAAEEHRKKGRAGRGRGKGDAGQMGLF